MKKPLRVPADTLAAQATASDPQLSAWVSANAGSGKTHVLAQRVVRLLLAGAEPSRILCLTYTRAAAANMADRVFRNLAAWTRLSDEALVRELAALEGRAPSQERLRQARRLFARALETPGGLKIQTIHAFCEAVLHQFTLEANIAGHFELLDPPMEAALVAEARRAMIAGAAEGEPDLAEAFAQVLEIAGEKGLEDLLGEIVTRRERLRAFIAEIGDGGHGFEPLYEAFGVSAGEGAAGLLGSIWPDAYFDAALAEDLAARATAAGKKTAAGFAEALAEALGTPDPQAVLAALRKAFLTQKREPKSARNIAAKGVAEHFPALEDEFSRFAAGLCAVEDRLALMRMLDATRAALTLADWLIARYEALKSARGFLDFGDLIARTVSLLSRQDAGAWVQYKLDKGIDHILLDEAQDTSPEQWEVVRRLAGEFFAGLGAREDVRRTVFAVGDEKQSIYSFQGAEPEAFDRSGHEFREKVLAARDRFERVRLTRSFRSTGDVLSAVDLVFSNAAVREGLTRDPEEIRHSPVRDNDPGLVEVWPSLGPETVEEPDDWTQAIDHASAPAVRLARDIARTIEHWLVGGERIEGQGRPITPGDILVLVRKRDSFVHALTRELKDGSRAIPVTGADRLRLADHIAVQDLMALGRFVLQPDDDLSLAALLKSPVFGLDEEALFALAAGRAAKASLFSVLRARAGEDGTLAPVAARLAMWRAEAGFRKPFEFYAGILGRDGVRRAMVARLGEEAGDILDEFLNFCLSAERTGMPSLEALLALLEGGGPEIRRELDQSRGEVRIMTAHAAKGLEAPVVILVDSGGAPHVAGHLPRLMRFEPPAGAGWRVPGFLWRAGADMANGVLTELEAEAARKAEEEYRRLLYVGMTRAEDRLIVCGYHGARGRPPMTWHAIVEAALAAAPHTAEAPHPVTGEKMLRYRLAESGTAAAAASAPEAAAPTRAQAVPAALLRPLPAPPTLPRPLSPSGAAALIEPDTGMVAQPSASPVLGTAASGSFALERGRAAHRLLQVLPSLPQEDREAAARRYLSRIGRDWPQGERESLWASVSAILGGGAFAPLFCEGSRAEVSVMGTVHVGGTERAVTGKIDRIAVAESKVLIVDYKTNRPAPSRAEEAPEGHVAQLALYRALLAPLYPGCEIVAGLVYTEVPLLIEVGTAAMDAALVRLGRA